MFLKSLWDYDSRVDERKSMGEVQWYWIGCTDGQFGWRLKSQYLEIEGA